MVHQTVRRKFQHMLLATPVHWESQFGTVTKYFQCYNFTPILYGSLKETMYYQQCSNCSRTLTFLSNGLNRLNRWFYFPTTGCIFVLKTFTLNIEMSCNIRHVWPFWWCIYDFFFKCRFFIEITTNKTTTSNCQHHCDNVEWGNPQGKN